MIVVGATAGVAWQASTYGNASSCTCRSTARNPRVECSPIPLSNLSIASRSGRTLVHQTHKFVGSRRLGVLYKAASDRRTCGITAAPPARRSATACCP
ncbi:hypothetical protein MRX96_010229 [Rhipicephalus microplus]